jgi:hypothetical protein
MTTVITTPEAAHSAAYLAWEARDADLRARYAHHRFDLLDEMVGELTDGELADAAYAGWATFWDEARWHLDPPDSLEFAAGVLARAARYFDSEMVLEITTSLLKERAETIGTTSIECKRPGVHAPFGALIWEPDKDSVTVQRTDGLGLGLRFEPDICEVLNRDGSVLMVVRP